jgi:hypothetical protein
MQVTVPATSANDSNFLENFLVEEGGFTVGRVLLLVEDEDLHWLRNMIGYLA